MSIFDVFGLLGGLAFFLFGMNLMGESLEKRAGNRLKIILEQLTKSPIKGLLLGAVATAVTQSSSAVTVMVVGFVNSGIMHLGQAINVVMGSNIGTTITAWLLSLSGIQSDNIWISLLKPSTFTPILAFLGILLMFLNKRKRDAAGILLGFSILMYGMTMMSDAVKGLAQDPGFISLLSLFQSPLLGVLIGALVTAILQSSSASVGVLQAIANTGTLQYSAALPIIMGQNIGTCVTALISSAGANRNAKRVAVVHLLFNLIGTALFLSVFYLLNAIFRFAFMNQPVNALLIAVTHTVFNVLGVAVMFPFSAKLEWLTRKIIRDSKEVEHFDVLDDRLLATPAIAVDQCRKLTGEMAQHAQNAFLHALVLLDGYNDKAADAIKKTESDIDLYEDKLGTYLVKLSTHNLTPQESREVSKLLHIIGDFERISDHAVNLAEVAEEIDSKGVQFSPAAQHETRVMRNAVTEVLEHTVTAYVNNDLALAEQVEPLEEVVDLLRTQIKAAHIDRLRMGSCTIELGFVLSDLLNNLERVSDHCSNIAASIIESERHGNLQEHEYTKSLKTGELGARFTKMYEAFLEKYDLSKSAE